MKKKCIECGRAFYTTRKQTIRCKKCQKIVGRERREKFFIIRNIRSAFIVITMTNPERAKQIMKEMEETEGKDFVQMVIGNTFDDIRSGKIVPRPFNPQSHWSYIENKRMRSVKIRENIEE